MNIYLISQEVNTGYDTYDSAVVVAKNEEDARTIHPGHHGCEYENNNWNVWLKFEDRSEVKVEFIGVADKTLERGVVLASFNAG